MGFRSEKRDFLFPEKSFKSQGDFLGGSTATTLKKLALFFEMASYNGLKILLED